MTVDTARRYDLFSELLSTPLRATLSHQQIAFLLASDELNIFATAKYIRLTATTGAEAARRLPRTLDRFPGLRPGAYYGNSRTWPPDNIRALASEYTSAAWDDRIDQAWGDFVYEAYLDLMPAPPATSDSHPDPTPRTGRPGMR